MSLFRWRGGAMHPRLWMRCGLFVGVAHGVTPTDGSYVQLLNSLSLPVVGPISPLPTDAGRQPASNQQPTTNNPTTNRPVQIALFYQLPSKATGSMTFSNWDYKLYPDDRLLNHLGFNLFSLDVVWYPSVLSVRGSTRSLFNEFGRTLFFFLGLCEFGPSCWSQW